jgi:hypothetical protein
VIAALACACTTQTNLNDGIPTPVPLPVGAVPAPVDDGLLAVGACAAYAAVDPLEGVLHADSGNVDWPVWLRAPDGHRIYVRWPAGFSVRFGLKAELLDDQGFVVLTEREVFRLPQVNVGEHLGTAEEPYLARGLWERQGHCYAKRGGPL